MLAGCYCLDLSIYIKGKIPEINIPNSIKERATVILIYIAEAPNLLNLYLWCVGGQAGEDEQGQVAQLVAEYNIIFK